MNRNVTTILMLLSFIITVRTLVSQNIMSRDSAWGKAMTEINAIDLKIKVPYYYYIAGEDVTWKLTVINNEHRLLLIPNFIHGYKPFILFNVNNAIDDKTYMSSQWGYVENVTKHVYTIDTIKGMDSIAVDYSLTKYMTGNESMREFMKPGRYYIESSLGERREKSNIYEVVPVSSINTKVTFNSDSLLVVSWINPLPNGYAIAVRYVFSDKYSTKKALLKWYKSEINESNTQLYKLLSSYPNLTKRVATVNKTPVIYDMCLLPNDEAIILYDSNGKLLIHKVSLISSLYAVRKITPADYRYIGAPFMDFRQTDTMIGDINIEKVNNVKLIYQDGVNIQYEENGVKKRIKVADIISDKSE